MNYLKRVRYLTTNSIMSLQNIIHPNLLRCSSGSINLTGGKKIENNSSSSSSFAKSGILSLQNTLQNRVKPFSITEWKTIRNELISTQKYINEVNVDATILGLCNSPNHLDIAKSYIEFLKSEGLELNNASLGRLMKIYYLVYKSGLITETDKNDIVQIYQIISQRHKILDSTTCENLIHGIIATDKWKVSLDLLNMIELTCKPSTSAYSTIITRAFEPNGDEDIGWKLLREMVSNNKQPKCEIFLAYLKRCTEDKQTFKNNVEKMLQFIEENEILVSKQVIDEMQFLFGEFGIHSSLTKLTRNGKCNSCKVHLKKISLTKEEFEKLQSVFLNKVLIRKDVFLKSLPEEVDSFIKFIDKTAPYDCVIDGLNIAFSLGTKKNPIVYAELISTVVKYFVSKNKKVLVIGREHMKKWPIEKMAYVKQNAALFLTNNLSHDDPFLLYAALKSGPKTDFISRDFMRSHAFLLGHELKSIFRRWQTEHQYMIQNSNENGKLVVKEPIRHYLSAHKVFSTWHIPFRDFYVMNRSDIFEIPSNWLCVSF